MMPLLHMLSRARRLILVSFCLLSVGLCLVVAVKPDKYQAHMSFLVRNERAENLVSTDPHQNAIQLGDVTEENVNSEVELLGSTELLEAVVQDCHLEKEYLAADGRNRAVAIEKATRKLTKNLVITAVRKSSLIDVTYTSHDRSQSLEVLQVLAREYLAKRLTLHTTDAAAPFFRAKSDTLKASLRAAEDQRAAVLAKHGFTLLPDERKAIFQQVLDLRKSRDDVASQLADTDSRLIQTKLARARSADRVVTQQKVSANQYSVERLNTLLADLQNRRTELATKFRPGDRMIAQVDQEITDTRAALARAVAIQSEDRTTDVNPLRQTLDGQVDQLTAVQAGLRSRKAELDRQLAQNEGAFAAMERDGIDIDDLDREIKELEDNLAVYEEKALAAGVAEDLDAARISNVVLSTPPMAPVLPAPSPINYFTAVLLAALLSVSLGLVSQMRTLGGATVTAPYRPAERMAD